MVLPTVLILNVILCGILALPHDVGLKSQRVYNTPENIMSVGYQAETHHATTHDGYILEMHRIPYKRHTTEGDPDRPVVLLMHGLLAASNSFIFLGPEYSISFNLADAGFDVWMGNARGTRNSRFHVTLDADSQDDRVEFFDFSWEEIGMYDVATMVDYILEKTGKQKLHYIGHSQGGTAFLVLGAMRPEYNEKLASVHLLAGVGLQDYFPNFILRNLARITNTIWALALRLGVVEAFPPGWLGITPLETKLTDSDTIAEETKYKYLLSDYCTGDPTMKEMCELFGISQILDQQNRIEDSLDVGTGGAAMKQIAHYGQNIRDTYFRRWDYGPEENLERYGSPTPPLYDLSLITANVTMHYTVSDNLLHENDVLAMAEIMPNTRARKVARESFLHADFVFASDVRELVTEYIIDVIRAVESPSNSNEGEDSDDENVSDGEDVDVSDGEGVDVSDGEGVDVSDGESDDVDVSDGEGDGDNVSDVESEGDDNESDEGPGSSSNIVLNVIVKIYLITFSFYCILSS